MQIVKSLRTSRKYPLNFEQVFTLAIWARRNYSSNSISFIYVVNKRNGTFILKCFLPKAIERDTDNHESNSIPIQNSLSISIRANEMCSARIWGFWELPLLWLWLAFVFQRDLKLNQFNSYTSIDFKWDVVSTSMVYLTWKSNGFQS